MFFIDTNIFAYALLDRGRKGAACTGLLDQVVRGKQASTSPLVLDELMWVLAKNGRAGSIPSVVAKVCAMPNLTVLPVGGQTAEQASKLVAEFGLKPRDAMHLAVMREHGLSAILSDDRDFDKIKGIKRIAP